jgi:hypothetical protein
MRYLTVVPPASDEELRAMDLRQELRAASDAALRSGFQMFKRKKAWMERHPKVSAVFPFAPALAVRLRLAALVLRGRFPQPTDTL